MSVDLNSSDRFGPLGLAAVEEKRLSIAYNTLPWNYLQSTINADELHCAIRWRGEKTGLIISEFNDLSL